jgi:hypothetical protein
MFFVLTKLVSGLLNTLNKELNIYPKSLVSAKNDETRSISPRLNCGPSFASIEASNFQTMPRGTTAAESIFDLGEDDRSICSMKTSDLSCNKRSNTEVYSTIRTPSSTVILKDDIGIKVLNSWCNIIAAN